MDIGWTDAGEVDMANDHTPAEVVAPAYMAFHSQSRDAHGMPLVPGYNVDPVDISAGLECAVKIGYDDGIAEMVVVYALQRHQRGEEDGAERTWLAQYPRDLTSWRMILASAVAQGTRAIEATS